MERPWSNGWFCSPGILVFLFLYILVMDTLGFIASSSAFLVFVHQLLVFTETGRLSPVKGLAVSAVFFTVLSSALFFMFNTVFHLAFALGGDGSIGLRTS